MDIKLCSNNYLSHALSSHQPRRRPQILTGGKPRLARRQPAFPPLRRLPGQKPRLRLGVLAPCPFGDALGDVVALAAVQRAGEVAVAAQRLFLALGLPLRKLVARRPVAADGDIGPAE